MKMIVYRFLFAIIFTLSTIMCSSNALAHWNGGFYFGIGPVYFGTPYYYPYDYYPVYYSSSYYYPDYYYGGDYYQCAYVRGHYNAYGYWVRGHRVCWYQ